MSQRLRVLGEIARGLIFITVPVVWSITDFVFDAVAIVSVWTPLA